MKLFLASSFDQSVSLFQKIFGSKKGRKVIFIANAADNHKGDKWWVKSDRDAFLKLGCKVTDVDLRSITKKDLAKLLKESDIIHFCGGSVIYLICIIKERGFVKLINEAVRKGGVIYTGTSAGSMIVAEDLTINAYDPEEKEFVARMKDNSGLGLVNFLIIPHTNSKDFAKGNAKMVSELPEIKSSQPLIFIYDGQAVLVDDGKIKLIK
jgi:peptidase E